MRWRRCAAWQRPSQAVLPKVTAGALTPELVARPACSFPPAPPCRRGRCLQENTQFERPFPVPLLSCSPVHLNLQPQFSPAHLLDCSPDPKPLVLCPHLRIGMRMRIEAAITVAFQACNPKIKV